MIITSVILEDIVSKIISAQKIPIPRDWTLDSMSDSEVLRRPRKQLRCSICNKLIARKKGEDRKCCAWCKQDYLGLGSRKWVKARNLTREQKIEYLKVRAKIRKKKYET